MSKATNQVNCCLLGDCLEVMKDIPNNSIDMVLTDLPFEVLECNWDKMIDLKSLWSQLERITKEKSAIIFTSTFKFALKLVNSNEKLFRYELIWDKVKPSNIFVGKLRPLPTHELILIFSKGTIANKSKKLMNYYPIMETQNQRQSKIYSQSDAMYRDSHIGYDSVRDQKYPKSIIKFSNANQNGKTHPTQKPLSLFEYLIKTYSKEGEIVLDCCAGSGTTAISCINTKRNYICIEKDEGYFKFMKDRISQIKPFEVISN